MKYLLLFLLRLLLPIAAAASDSISRVLDSRIVNGDDVTDPAKYPFYVRFQVVDGGDKYQCGGTLIYDDVVLTAAHCFHSQNGRYLDDAVGYIYYDSTNNYDNRNKRRRCQKIIIDPQYDHDLIYSDFALCKLESPVPSSLLGTNTNGKPLLVLNDNASVPVDGRMLTAIGFGRTYQGSDVAYILQELVDRLPAISNQECREEGSYNYQWISERELCAGYLELTDDITDPNLSFDTAGGDSGGPLMKRTVLSNGQIQYLQVGVVSWGIGCGRVGSPGVYARVSSRYDWIQSNACSESSFCGNSSPTQAPAPSPTRSPVDDSSDDSDDIIPTEAPVEPTEAPVVPTEAPVATDFPDEPTDGPTSLISRTDGPTFLSTSMGSSDRITCPGKEFDWQYCECSVDCIDPFLKELWCNCPEAEECCAAYTDSTTSPTELPTEFPTARPTNRPTARPTNTNAGPAAPYNFVACNENGEAICEDQPGSDIRFNVVFGSGDDTVTGESDDKMFKKCDSMKGFKGNKLKRWCNADAKIRKALGFENTMPRGTMTKVYNLCPKTCHACADTCEDEKRPFAVGEKIRKKCPFMESMGTATQVRFCKNKMAVLQRGEIPLRDQCAKTCGLLGVGKCGNFLSSPKQACAVKAQ